MHKDFSPEERLLRLIRSKGNKEAQEDAPKIIPVRARPSYAKASEDKHAAPLHRLRLFWWKNLNIALAVLLAVLVTYSIPIFLKMPRNMLEGLEERLKAQENAAEKKAQGYSQRPSADYFLEALGKRNIFSPVIREEVQPGAPAQQGPKLEDIKGQLNLLGVVSGESPQAIIEDKRTQKSYFLNKGSTFDDIEVKDIFENKVVLTYKGQEFELVL